MSSPTDQQLLREYADHRSEAAYSRIVERHINFVHSAATRLTGDSDLAKDVAQSVFVALAKEAKQLHQHPVLMGWLHRTTRNIAAQTIRTEVRRRSREQEAAIIHEPNQGVDPSWQDLSPHLDAALANLDPADRDALLLRYFENKSANEMAQILNINPEAAQKRVSRAVHKLRLDFARRGIVAKTTSGFISILSANAITVAPMNLANTISASLLTSSGGASTAIIPKLLAMTTLQKSLAACSAALAAFAIYQSWQISALRERLESQQTGNDDKVTFANSNQSSIGPAQLLSSDASERRRNRYAEIEKQNAALRLERDQMKQSVEQKEYQLEYLQAINAKLIIDDQLQVPETPSEIAVVYGQYRNRSQQFYDKWNGKIPAEDSDEFENYKKDAEANLHDDATLMKSLVKLDFNHLADDPAGLSRFQSLQLYGALDLNDAEWEKVDQTMSHFYTDVFAQNLHASSRPSDGVEAWNARRNDIANQAFVEIQSHLTPEQRARFSRLYQPHFLFAVSVSFAKPKN